MYRLGHIIDHVSFTMYIYIIIIIEKTANNLCGVSLSSNPLGNSTKHGLPPEYHAKLGWANSF